MYHIPLPAMRGGDMILRLVWEGLWTTLAQMSPYLLFGFAVAGILSVTVSPETVERHLGKKTHPAWAVLKAALLGVPLPLCSCGVIPVTASLRKHGASRGAAVSFLISTPQTGVDSILVTYSLLGPVFTVVRPLIAFASGVFGGLAVQYFGRDGDGAEDAPPACEDPCCADAGPRPHPVLAVLRYGFVTLPQDIGSAILAGLLAAGLISALVPPHFFHESLLVPIAAAAGPFAARLAGMLLMMAVGIPLYVCATASVPIAAALIAKGISPGAALVFLMTGPATNAATIAMIWKVMGRRTALLYLASVAVAALLSGLGLDLMFPALSVSMMEHVHPEGTGWLEGASAVLLSAILLYAVLPRTLRRWGLLKDSAAGGAARPAPGTAGTVTLSIQGMTCGHCAQSVQRALSECGGVTSAEVDLEAGTAMVRGRQTDDDALIRAVGTLGFTAKRLLGLSLLLLLGCSHAPRSGPGPLSAPLPRLSPQRIGRALHAERITAGLAGEELRQARFENMVEAFLDTRDLEQQISFLKTQRWGWERRTKLKQNRAWLKVVRQSLEENSAAFPPEERVADVQEKFLDLEGGRKFIRRVTATLQNGRQVVSEKEYDKLPRTAPPGPLDSAP